MSKKINNIKVNLDETLEEKLQLLGEEFSSIRVLRKSLDARRRNQIHHVYNVELFEEGEEPIQREHPIEKFEGKVKEKPLIVGAGPAGLFAALRFVDRGVPCHLIEQGGPVEERIPKIARFWRHGRLDKYTNVCFGEGGAGLYSDGKLLTRVRSPHIHYVLRRLVDFGAPEEILYLANPHIGSDRIRRLMPKLRRHLLEGGCQISFNAPVKGMVINEKSVEGVELEDKRVIYGQSVILAPGHSANDLFEELYRSGVSIEPKSFAIGFRVEHPQDFVDRSQYKSFAGHPKLGAANYKLTHHDQESGIGVYSFCMCPGGIVLSSGTEEDGIVVNGMSNYLRNSAYANSAVVVTVDSKSWFGKRALGGIKFRREIEQKAFFKAKSYLKNLPVQKLEDFLNNKKSEGEFRGSSPSALIGCNLSNILAPSLTEKLREGFSVFDRKIRGFIHEEALLYGVETRTSSPIRILRDEETLQSKSHKGLFPCGEGAGYSGGITSSAIDGIECAEAVLRTL
jgi:uncharacterized FAD-dependent dehydrogenase